jgi:ribosome biogenesis GTPase
MRLEDFGWNSEVAQAFEPYAQQGHHVGRVCTGGRGIYNVFTESGEIEAVLSGKLRHMSSSAPVAGDWVVIRGGTNAIDAVLPRRTKFTRKHAGNRTEEQILAANVDVVFLVSGLDGDFNVRRIERYLVLAWESGARPVIVLNKSDVCSELDSVVQEVESVSTGVPVVLMSALEGDSLADLVSHVRPGETAALLGSSGVGKSTIVNRLLETCSRPTQPVREDDSHGRHTTTHRELIPMPGGWLLMDLPGLRELQLWTEDSSDSLIRTFADLTSVGAQCRFRDCSHQGEPGCAIAEALENGSLTEDRVESYFKLQREVARLARKQDEFAAAQDKKALRRVHKAMRHNVRKPGWRG